jgi:hypothetical protein
MAIEVITVVGKRPAIEPREFIIREPIGSIDRGDIAAAERDTGADLAFLAPAALPQVIEEIIVTAPKQAPPPVSSAPGLLSRLGLAGIVGGVLGLTAREILEDLGEQRLEDSYAQLMAPDAFVPGDTPVQPAPQPAPIPEIIVTAPRVQTVSRYVRAPQPQFFPREFEFDPWVMQPVTPRALPQTAPDVVVAPDFPNPTLPEVAPAPPAAVPQTVPATITNPFVQVSPEIDASPAARPLPLPLPLPTPDTFPGTGTDPLTTVQPTVGTSSTVQTQLGTSFFPFAEVQPEVEASECAPCKDKQEREKPRTECWRKMVKEAIFPSWDEEYQWVKIDCLTGREI